MLSQTGFPLSALQTKLWLRQSDCPEAGRFHSAALFRLEGEWRCNAIVEALSNRLAGQAIFKTAFQRLAGLKTAIQVEDRRSRPQVVFNDLSSLQPADRSQAVREAAEQIRSQAFDLGQGPSLRAHLLKLSEREHRLLLCCHPLVGDLQSLIFIACGLLRDLGSASSCSQQEIPFQQFAVQHNAMLKEGEFEQEKAFWQDRRNQDGPASGPLWLSLSAQPGNWRKCGLALEKETVSRLQALPGRQGQAAFLALSAVLTRLFARRRLPVAWLSDTRPFFEIGETLGPLTELIEWIPDMDGRQPFSELLPKGMADLSLLIENQAFVPEAQPEGARLAFADLTTGQQQRAMVEECWAHWPGVDLLAALSGPQDAPILEVQFDEAKIPPRQAETLLLRWRELLSRFLLFGQEPCGHRSILLPAESEIWLSRFNLPLEAPSEETVPGRIVDWTLRCPDRIASQCGSSMISFAALAGQSARIASDLQASGVGRGDVIALHLEPSFEMLASVLAVWLTGAAYLPLDPLDPPRRNSLLVEDSGALMALTSQGAQLDGIPAMSALMSGAGQAPFDAGRWTGRSTPQDIAYILYTSGSTGRPKGVAILHHSLANYLNWVNHALLSPAEELPVLTKLIFDASLKQLFAPLIGGKPVWFIPPETIKDPRALVAELRLRPRVGINCVPALWAALLAELQEEESMDARRSIRGVYLGGEQLPADLVAGTQRLLPEAEFCNLYGPTEATANASWTRIAPHEPITIGRPIANARVYVLDSWGHLCPPETLGEICIGGQGVASGYWNRPALTAERFVPDPFSQLPGARMFRSGDRAALSEQGKLVFCGRLDGQVKIRGYRVEVGEIETVIAQFEGVAECAVSLVGEDRSGRTLAAFVVHKGQSDLDGLRHHLSRRLPAYMVPDTLLELPALPRLASQKIDRQRLSSPSFLSALQTKPYVAPANPEEAQIADIWQRVLGVDQVSVDADIFSVGGHSLAAARIVNQITDRFGVGISLEAFLNSATISGVAALVSAARKEKGAVLEEKQ